MQQFSRCLKNGFKNINYGYNSYYVVVTQYQLQINKHKMIDEIIIIFNNNIHEILT